MAAFKGRYPSLGTILALIFQEQPQVSRLPSPLRVAFATFDRCKLAMASSTYVLVAALAALLVVSMGVPSANAARPRLGTYTQNFANAS